ncbi:29210_t:CDS:2, partial [Gigaspora margarita]
KKNISEIKNALKKLIKERKAFLSRLLYRQDISKNVYELEISKLGELESQLHGLENNKNLSQNENNKLKEENLKLQRIVNMYEKTLEDDKIKLERYYYTIEKTFSILQNVFVSNEIDTRELTELCNEIKEICEEGSIVASASSDNNRVFNSFEDAIMASEPKIVEVNEENFGEKTMPPLKRQYRFGLYDPKLSNHFDDFVLDSQATETFGNCYYLK